MQVWKPQLSILTKELTFTPTGLAKHRDLKSVLHSFTRKRQITEIFHDVENTDKSLDFNNSIKQFKTQNKYYLNIVKEIEFL